eukprot:COSAG01_NODE_156_length_23748_cov_439.062371_22_plen_536_part_00
MRTASHCPLTSPSCKCLPALSGWRVSIYTSARVCARARACVCVLGRGHPWLGVVAGREVVYAQAATAEMTRLAPWVHVRSRRDQCPSMHRPSHRSARVDALRSTLRLMEHQWQMECPSLIISVTGDATRSFDLRPEFHRLFTHALVSASLQGQTWIMTGGTNRGIMRAIGDAMASFHATTPCIGVATWGTLRNRESFEMAAEHADDLPMRSAGSRPVRCISEPTHRQLLTIVGRLCGDESQTQLEQLSAHGLLRECEREAVLRPALREGRLGLEELGTWLAEEKRERWISLGREKSWLDVNHSHYLLLDNGSEGEYGAEVAFRAELEDMCSFCGFDLADDSASFAAHRCVQLTVKCPLCLSHVLQLKPALCRRNVLLQALREHTDPVDFAQAVSRHQRQMLCADASADPQMLSAEVFESCVREAWKSATESMQAPPHEAVDRTPSLSSSSFARTTSSGGEACPIGLPLVMQHSVGSSRGSFGSDASPPPLTPVRDRHVSKRSTSAALNHVRLVQCVDARASLCDVVVVRTPLMAS